MQFSAATIARAKILRGVFTAFLWGSILLRAFVDQADATLQGVLGLIAIISAVGTLLSGVVDGSFGPLRKALRRVALVLAILLPLAALQAGIVEAAVALPIALIALTVGIFALVRSAGQRPVVALVGALGSVAVLIFAGYAVSIDQPLLAAAASITFGVAVTAAIVMSVNRSE
jgi:hypothetical protein